MFFFFDGFRPSQRRSTYSRRGFRLGGNTLILLLIFFMIGLFLQYGGRTEPLVVFWNDLKSLVGLHRSGKEAEKTYKVPELINRGKRNQYEDTDDQSTSKSVRKVSKRTRVRDVKVMESSAIQRFDFEKLVDFALPAMGSNDVIIRHEAYTLRYRETYEQADWVAYSLLEKEVFGDADRDNAQFQPDPMVETGSALPSDYSRSGYDRGHLAPAGDFKLSERMMRETFYMSNISPQEPDFNRGIWKELEEQVRAWAVRDKELYVVTGPVLKPELPTIGKRNQVAVPEYYYKVILYCNNPQIRVIGFLLRNAAADKSLKQFVVSVDEIERKTGIDFFPKIPDELERKLERTRPSQMIADWFSF